MSGPGVIKNESVIVGLLPAKTTDSREEDIVVAEYEEEGSASCQQATEIREQRHLGVLKATAYTLLSFALGGYAQWEGELDKALGLIRNESPGKFENGITDFNHLEEILEGGIPSAFGALVGLMAIRGYASKFDKDITPRNEAEAMVVGATLGYMAMAWGGYFVHQYLDVPDVKWGGFK